MRLLGIKPVEYQIAHCFIYSLATFANYVRYEYELLLAGTWNFTFREHANEIYFADRIECFREDEIKDIANTIYKINYFWFDKEQSANVADKIKSEITNDVPVAVTMRANCCSWLTFYKKQLSYPINNAVLIVGFDDENSFYGINNSTQTVVKISNSDFTNGYVSGACFKIINDNNTDYKYDQIYKNIIRKYYQSSKKKMFYDIRAFAGKIGEIDFYKELFGVGDINASPVLRKLMFVENSRYNCSKFFEFISNKCKDSNLMSYSKALEKSANDWNLVKNLFIKSCYIGKSTELTDKISSKLNQIADNEEEVFNKIITYA